MPTHRRHPFPSENPPGPAFVRKILAGYYGEEVLRPLHASRPDPRITTSRLLPQILKLKEQGRSYRQIADKLGVRKKQVEHVMARHRKNPPT